MVTKTLGQFEKNVGISFSYVKKDLLSVNDMVSDLHEKIQHLSMNQAMLVDKVIKLEQMVTKKEIKREIKKAPARRKAAPKKAKAKKNSKPVKKIVKETTVYQ